MNNLFLWFSSQRKQCATLFKGLACFLLLISTVAFQPYTQEVPALDDSLLDDKKITTLHSDQFSEFTKQIYNQIEYSAGYDTVSYTVFSNALRGYMYLKHTASLNDTKYLTLIDFSQYCNDRRMWVIDMETRKVVFNEWVAHGSKTGNTYAKYFSNKHSSNQSSLGFYTTGGLYNGSNNLSLKLNGLEKDFNSNAFTRGIVIHGANYVSESIVNRKERIGRSFGCPAVSQQANEALVNTIKGGNCLFIYHPTPAYLENSKIMNANLYIPVEDLSI